MNYTGKCSGRETPDVSCLSPSTVEWSARLPVLKACESAILKNTVRYPGFPVESDRHRKVRKRGNLAKAPFATCSLSNLSIFHILSDVTVTSSKIQKWRSNLTTTMILYVVFDLNYYWNLKHFICVSLCSLYTVTLLLFILPSVSDIALYSIFALSVSHLELTHSSKIYSP